jgi:hypothetical protein
LNLGTHLDKASFPILIDKSVRFHHNQYLDEEKVAKL